MTAPPGPSLTDVYLAQRDALIRFFQARGKSPSDVEDLMQDLYLKVVALPPQTDIREARAFLYRLASNLMLDRWRSAQRSAVRDTAWRSLTHVTGPHATGTGEDIADEPSAEDVVAGRQRLAGLVATLDRLPDKTRAIFRLHKFDDLSYAEVAAHLGISRSSVEKHMMDALRKLAASDRK
ncbi:N/A [soil metagenome]